jgi:sigma-B regulation protein RsbU (phosphoserine phosphatase)
MMSRFGAFGDFWRRVTEGLTLQELWFEFRKETGTSYRLYSREFEAQIEGQPPLKRGLKLARVLFWATLLKLSPTRRIFLLVALVLLVARLAGGPPALTAAGTAALLVLLALELADRVALKRDLEIAREIQKWLVPQSPPSVPGVDIAFTTRPANTVAGDFYDAFLCPAPDGAGASERLLLVVADVAGKGMPAALLMASFQSSLKTLVQKPIPLPELVSRLCRYSCGHSLEGLRFTTALIAEFDPLTGSLAYVNAGHNPPALCRADGTIEWLSTGGLPLGIDAGVAYESGALTLGRDDLLVIFTDGVVEARNDRGEEYGESRLPALLKDARQSSAAETLARLMSSVDSFVGTAPRFDDITCLVARYTGPVRGAEPARRA